MPHTSPTFLFIGGPPRSGTTLLMEILNASDLIALMHEYQVLKLSSDIEPIFSHGDAIAASYERTRNREREHRMAATATERSGKPQPSNIFFSREKLATYPIPDPAKLHSPPHWPHRSNRGRIVAGIIKASLNKPLARLLGSKDPLFALSSELHKIHDLGSPCRFIWIFRNPLKTINSAINRRNRNMIGIDEWGIASANDAIAQYRLVVAKTIATIAAFAPDESLVLKYEDLVENEERTIGKVLAFLGIAHGSLPHLAERDRGNIPVCTQTEHDMIMSEFGDAITSWQQLELTGQGYEAIPALSRLLATPRGLPDHIDATNMSEHLGYGWSEVEPGRGAWSISSYASIVLPPVAYDRANIIIDAHVFVTSPISPVEVSISVNQVAHHECAWALNDNTHPAPEGVQTLSMHERISISLRNVRMSAARANLVEFNLRNIRSPLEAGVGPDPRKLCIYIRGVRIQTRHED